MTDTDSAAEGPDQVAKPGSEKLVGGEGAVQPVPGRATVVLIAK